MSTDKFETYSIEDLFLMVSELEAECQKCGKENLELKKELESIENDFKFSWTHDCVSFDGDKMDIKDVHTRISLNNGKLFIEVFIPETDDYYRFMFYVTGMSASESRGIDIICSREKSKSG